MSFTTMKIQTIKVMQSQRERNHKKKFDHGCSFVYVSIDFFHILFRETYIFHIAHICLRGSNIECQITEYKNDK